MFLRLALNSWSHCLVSWVPGSWACTSKQAWKKIKFDYDINEEERETWLVRGQLVYKHGGSKQQEGTINNYIILVRFLLLCQETMQMQVTGGNDLFVLQLVVYHLGIWKQRPEAETMVECYVLACSATFLMPLRATCSRVALPEWARPSSTNSQLGKYPTDMSTVQSDKGNSSIEVPFSQAGNQN